MVLSATEALQAAPLAPVAMGTWMPSAVVAVSSDRAGMIDFFSSQGLVYMPSIKCRDQSVKSLAALAAANCEEAARRLVVYKAHLSDRVKAAFVDTMEWAGDEREYGMTPKLGIAFIGAGIGFGCFALRGIKRGDLIGEYTGYVYDLAEISGSTYVMRNNPWDECVKAVVRGRHPMLLVDAARGGNETRFINHTSDDVVLKREGRRAANLDIYYAFSGGSFHALLYANRRIMPGEELRCDYGSYYWSVEHASDESRVFRLTGDGIRDVATAQAS